MWTRASARAAGVRCLSLEHARAKHGHTAMSCSCTTAPARSGEEWGTTTQLFQAPRAPQRAHLRVGGIASAIRPSRVLAARPAVALAVRLECQLRRRGVGCHRPPAAAWSFEQHSLRQGWFPPNSPAQLQLQSWTHRRGPCRQMAAITTIARRLNKDLGRCLLPTPAFVHHRRTWRASLALWAFAMDRPGIRP